MKPDTHATILDYLRDGALGKRHATLFDPEVQSPEVAAEKAQICIEAGTNMILVGGSTNTPDSKVHATVQSIQEAIELRCWAASQDFNGDPSKWQVPVVLFPSGSHALSPAADAITFMSLMNSREQRYIIGEQSRGAKYIVEHKIEPISTGYLICEPGGEAGAVGKAELIDSTDTEQAIIWATTAECFKFDLLYLEAGSGAATSINTDFIKAARSNFSGILAVGGGIKSPEIAHEITKAGADWIVTGTLVEEIENKETLRETINQIKTTINP